MFEIKGLRDEKEDIIQFRIIILNNELTLDCINGSTGHECWYMQSLNYETMLTKERFTICMGNNIYNNLRIEGRDKILEFFALIEKELNQFFEVREDKELKNIDVGKLDDEIYKVRCTLNKICLDEIRRKWILDV